MAATIMTTYEEFEPLCRKWEGIDTLEVHLQGFKKEQLRVLLNNRGVMRISGERAVDKTKLTGFYKEITIPKDIKTNEIRAKFLNDILYITMPKQTPQTPLLPQQITSPPKTQENEQKKPEMGPEAVLKKTDNIELDGKYITMPEQTPQAPSQPQQITSPPKTQENEQKKPEMDPEAVPKKTENTELDGKENGLIKKDEDDNESKENEFVQKIQLNRNMAVCVRGAFALLVGIGVFLIYFELSKFKI